MKWTVVSLLFLAALSGPARSGPHKNVSPASLVQQVKKAYAGIKELKAGFREERTAADSSDVTRTDGDVMALRPDKMRWEQYVKRKKKDHLQRSVIDDGSAVTVIEYDTRDVVQGALANCDLVYGLAFAIDTIDIVNDFDAGFDTSETFGTGDEVVLRLRPKTADAPVATIYFVVDDTLHVTQSIVVRGDGAMTHLWFFAVDPTYKGKSSLYQFDAKSDAARGYNLRADSDCGC